MLHDFAEQIERLLTLVLLLLLGGAIVGGLLAPLTWQAAAVGLALVSPGPAGRRLVVAAWRAGPTGAEHWL